MSGREERRGRLIGSLPALLPQVVGYLIHDVAVGASAQDFVYHQVMGVIFFAGAAATTLIVNARWVYPVQPPGTSPLGTKGTGSFLMTMLLQLVGFAGTALLPRMCSWRWRPLASCPPGWRSSSPSRGPSLSSRRAFASEGACGTGTPWRR